MRRNLRRTSICSCLLLQACGGSGGEETETVETETANGTSSGGSITIGETNDPNTDSMSDTGANLCPTLTNWEQMILDDHNNWRSSVDPPASEMYRVYWDTEIAANAAGWVSSCDSDWPHSPEEERTGVGGYEVLGENLSYCAGTGCSDLPEVMDDSGKGDADGWWAEHTDYNWEDDSSNGVTSHYTQMASSNVYAIGCATQLCEAPGPGGWDGDWWWTICQYGPRGKAYWVGNKPYEAGDGGLVESPESTFDDHPGLCKN
ncbi:MAG: CAP domain-containing protein [Nannocystaceae bacterium]